MIEKRSAAQIREYCEAASEGPWTPGLTIGASCDVRTVSGQRLVTHFANEYDRTFAISARVDLPRVLEVAVKLRDTLEWLHNFAEFRGLDDIADARVRAALAETAWLADEEETPAEQVLRHIDQIAAWVAEPMEEGEDG